MKQSVTLSTYSSVLSAICTIIVLGALYYCRHNYGIYLIGAILIAWMFLVLFYMPMSISADDKEVCIHRALKIKSIPVSEIKSVELCPPTMAERRICGSGGWFGYWGWFSEPSIGKYFAYYGKASDCFLVMLKDGRRYLLGCENAPSMVSYIKDKIG